MSDGELDNRYQITFNIPFNLKLRGLLCNIIMQLIAYEVALLKGHNCDYPKHLAKVISTY